MHPDDARTLRDIKLHRSHIAGWHPGDDSPYSHHYGGYTVRDTRAGMARRTEDIHRKYGIEPKRPSQSTLDKADARDKQKRDTRGSIDSQVKEKFPHIDTAHKVLGVQTNYQMRKPGKYSDRSKITFNFKAEKKKVADSLVGTPFASHNKAAQYRTEANKLKNSLLVKAGIR